ncbi:hypothetical protein [Tautonia plasticadhaerens]|uniref:Uncharacterized protein n=1 Tax=Tautonia plasticadhaerens TaxID=2527974 RepID=A0A518HAR3_9BACT|nr:hypothetical protein [Tautonia plasticadhaerens]QDV37933.1 hypothetical protein ElP_58800 [Tautonia plasticadhaerens]
MKNATSLNSVSYVSWILGQTSAMLGMILCLLWGFDLVILQSQQLYSQAGGEVAATIEVWYPTFGPPLAGLGMALAGWSVSHVQHLRTPAPVVVAAALNLMALVLAMVASAY